MCRRLPERDGMIAQFGQSFKVLCRQILWRGLLS